jgi:hypothetical protein
MDKNISGPMWVLIILAMAIALMAMAVFITSLTLL